MDKSDIRFVLDLSLRQISLNSIFRPVKIFENAKEGIYACSNENKIEISENDVHHNRPFGLSLDGDSHLVIRDNKIFENGFWGILANRELQP